LIFRLFETTRLGLFEARQDSPTNKFPNGNFSQARLPSTFEEGAGSGFQIQTKAKPLAFSRRTI